jgi:hypothetical protein
MARSPRWFGLGRAESRRLVDGGATVKERLLLQAGIDESPPNSAGRRRTLAALGVAVGASSVTSTATAAVVLGRGGALAQAKWVVFGAVGAAVAVGSVEFATRSDPVPPPSPAPVSTSVGRKATVTPKGSAHVVRALPPPAPPSEPSLLPAPYPVPDGARAPAVLSSSRPSRDRALGSPSVDLSRASRTEVASPAELVAQVAALDRARAALRAGRAGESVALLDRFDRSYPGSRLAPEATVVRVSALLALGRRTQATELVRAYCRTGGRGAYGHRLMTLVGLNETACEGSEFDR